MPLGDKVWSYDVHNKPQEGKVFQLKVLQDSNFASGLIQIGVQYIDGDIEWFTEDEIGRNVWFG